MLLYASVIMSKVYSRDDSLLHVSVSSESAAFGPSKKTANLADIHHRIFAEMFSSKSIRITITKTPNSFHSPSALRSDLTISSRKAFATTGGTAFPICFLNSVFPRFPNSCSSGNPFRDANSLELNVLLPDGWMPRLEGCLLAFALQQMVFGRGTLPS